MPSFFFEEALARCSTSGRSTWSSESNISEDLNLPTEPSSGWVGELRAEHLCIRGIHRFYNANHTLRRARIELCKYISSHQPRHVKLPIWTEIARKEFPRRTMSSGSLRKDYESQKTEKNKLRALIAAPTMTISGPFLHLTNNERQRRTHPVTFSPLEPLIGLSNSGHIVDFDLWHTFGLSILSVFLRLHQASSLAHHIHALSTTVLDLPFDLRTDSYTGKNTAIDRFLEDYIHPDGHARVWGPFLTYVRAYTARQTRRPDRGSMKWSDSPTGCLIAEWKKGGINGLEMRFHKAEADELVDGLEDMGFME